MSKVAKKSTQPKPRKAGRPPLPEGNAKAMMLRVRVTPDERTALEMAAKAHNQTVSEWIRTTLNAAIQS
jgi:predicted HicB family RNase H-like nuclease